MTEIEILTWLCIIGIIVGGVMNLRHTESTLVIRQDFREKLDKEQADRYQILIGIVYIVAGVIAALFNFFADGLVYMAVCGGCCAGCRLGDLQPEVSAA